MFVKEVEYVQVSGIVVQCFVGFVDSVGLNGYIITPFYGKSITFTWFEGDSVIQVFYTHKS
jgi:hypothetical protein